MENTATTGVVRRSKTPTTTMAARTRSRIPPLMAMVMKALICRGMFAPVRRWQQRNDWGHGTYTLGNGGLTGVPDATYQLSSNVYLYYANDTTNNHAHYAVSSLHKSGNRSFATSDNTTLIYYWTKTVGATVDSNAVQTAGTTTFSNGTAL